MKFLINKIKSVPALSAPALFLFKRYNRARLFFVKFDYSAKLNPSISKEILLKYNASRALGPQPIICHAPFTNLHFRFNGDVNVCTHNKNFTLGNISTASIQQLWNGPKAEELRNFILNYNLSNGCYYCQRQLQGGNYDGLYAQTFDWLPFLSGKNNKLKPLSMEFELINTCNLECVMCTGDYSNLIRQNREGREPMPMLYGERFLEELKEFLPSLETVTFTGGEPTLITYYHKIWQLILEHNKNCRITVITNATVIDDTIEKFITSGRFNFAVSLDAMEKETYEYIRKNAVWENVLANIQKLITYRNKGLVNLSFEFCLTKENWKQLPLVLSFANDNNITVNFNPAIIPRHISLRSLPYEDIGDVIQFYNQIDFNTNGGATAILNNRKVQSIIGQLQFWQNKATNKTVLQGDALQYLESFLKNHNEFSKYPPQQIDKLIAGIGALLNSKADTVYHNGIITNIMDDIDLFFDESISIIGIDEVITGFTKIINWEIDGITKQKRERAL